MYGTLPFTAPEPVFERAWSRSIPIGGEARCLDGAAGRIARVVRDATGALTHLVIHRPGLLARRVLVPSTHTGEIGDDYVALKLRRAELDAYPEYRADDEIAADVERALRGMELFHDRDDFVAVRVGVTNGVIELRGYVRSEARRQEARAVASRIRGALEVRNHLFSDEAIERAIGDVLRSDTRLGGSQLRASSRFGVVDLYGEVASREQRVLATVITRHVPGVVAVNNLLRIAA